MNTNRFASSAGNWASILGIILAIIQVIVGVTIDASKAQSINVMKYFIIGSSCIIAVIFIIEWIFNRTKEIATIGYDYLPESPLNNGWFVGYPQCKNDNFSYSAITITKNINGIIFNNIYDFPIDINFTQNVGIAKAIEFYLQLSKDSAAYLHVLTSSVNGAKGLDCWVRLEIGNGGKSKVSGNEVNYPVKGKIINGYTLIKIDLETITKDCFAEKGLTFNKIIGMRLRGNLGIGQIRLLK